MRVVISGAGPTTTVEIKETSSGTTLGLEDMSSFSDSCCHCGWSAHGECKRQGKLGYEIRLEGVICISKVFLSSCLFGQLISLDNITHASLKQKSTVPAQRAFVLQLPCVKNSPTINSIAPREMYKVESWIFISLILIHITSITISICNILQRTIRSIQCNQPKSRQQIDNLPDRRCRPISCFKAIEKTPRSRHSYNTGLLIRTASHHSTPILQVRALQPKICLQPSFLPLHTTPRNKSISAGA